MPTATGKCQHIRVIVTDASEERNGAHFRAYCGDCGVEGPVKDSVGEAWGAFPRRNGKRPLQRVRSNVQLGFEGW